MEPDSPLKKSLEKLLSSSEILHLAVWVDGQFTPLEALNNGSEVHGRELYFKVEGRVNRRLPE